MEEGEEIPVHTTPSALVATLQKTSELAAGFINCCPIRRNLSIPFHVTATQFLRSAFTKELGAADSTHALLPAPPTDRMITQDEPPSAQPAATQPPTNRISSKPWTTEEYQ